MSTITHLDPLTLTISPLLDRILMLSAIDSEDAATEYAAGLLATRKTGKIRVPLKVQEGTTLIVDGRHRREWAIACELATVPVEYVTEAEALDLIRQEIFARRTMSKGQKAWLHLWLVPAIAAGKAGRPGISDIQCPNLDDAANEAGVSRSLMKEAAALYRIFTTAKQFTTAKHATAARRAVEERIWQGDGLGQILADLKPGIPPVPPPGPVDPAAASDALVAATMDKYTQLLLELDTELVTAKSYAHLPNAALHHTTTKLTAAVTQLATAAMARPDFFAAQKQQLLSALKASLEDTITAAEKSGLKVRA